MIGTAPDNTNFISILLWMPLLVPGPGCGPVGDLAVYHSRSPLSQRICIIPIAMGYLLKMKARNLAGVMWTCTPAVVCGGASSAWSAADYFKG
eukprot:1120223-Pelagomonas_calceolata.AAC.6